VASSWQLLHHKSKINHPKNLLGTITAPLISGAVMYLTIDSRLLLGSSANSGNQAVSFSSILAAASPGSLQSKSAGIAKPTSLGFAQAPGSVVRTSAFKRRVEA